MFEKGTTLVLDDDKEYAIVDEFAEEDKRYIYLVNIDDVTKFIIGTTDGDNITTVTDPDELGKVLKTFSDRLHPNN